MPARHACPIAIIHVLWAEAIATPPSVHAHAGDNCMHVRWTQCMNVQRRGHTDRHVLRRRNTRKHCCLGSHEPSFRQQDGVREVQRATNDKNDLLQVLQNSNSEQPTNDGLYDRRECTLVRRQHRFEYIFNMLAHIGNH